MEVPSSDPTQAPSTLTIAVPDKLATGNGLWGYGLSMTAVKTLDPALVFANLGYTGYVSRHFNNLSTNPNVQNPGDVSLGSTITYGLGLAFALNDKTSVSMSFSDQLARSARVRYDGGDWVTLGEKKLRGVEEKVTVLIPGESNVTMTSVEAAESDGLDVRLEAEHVMLLYRNSRERNPEKAGGNMLQ